ncbi:hypothetical protein EJ02DRAFT_513681 [Clathrospora elynae]|uniref:Uncharacterized protein n=1 Tax=Clathrospora elynae TaxID=706981 RepID=A0A6A5SHQ6_9PLEO|nr:hypothetical protein EJ02DRAFT_513681 [Clathrospora elynae]
MADCQCLWWWWWCLQLTSRYAHLSSNNMKMRQQSQSPLFHLPRELRDEIYEYYTYETDGYHHYPQALNIGEVRQANGESIDVPLKATCKRISDELKGTALRTNTIHFHPNEKRSDFATRSCALRFQRLIEYVNVTKWRMVLLAAECIDGRILEEVDRAHPDHHFGAVYNCARTDQQLPYRPFKFLQRYYNMEQHSISSHRALQHCLDLASAHPRFTERVAAACGDGLPGDFFTPRATFVSGSHVQVLNWNPSPWYIPSEAELITMESLLVNQEDIERFAKENHDDWLDWKFSACAVAIEAMDRLPPQTFANLRSIVLHEDSVAVSTPESHALGLVPLKRKNTNLRVERRVKGYSAYLSRWGYLTSIKLSKERRDQAMLFFETLLAWMEQTLDLPAKGLPAQTFTLLFEKDGDECVWAQLAVAIRMQEAMNEDYRRRNVPRPPITADERFLSLQFPLPCALPDWLPDLFRNMAEGTAVHIRYEGSLKEASLDDASDLPSHIESAEEWRDVWEKFALAQVQLQLT